MKQFSNRLLSISLAFILFCMSLFGSFAVPTIKVKGAEVLALYSVEEILATILFSLGVTIQGYDSLTDGSSALDLSSDRYQVIQGGGGSQEDPDQDPDPSSYVILPSKQDALSFEEQLKLSQEYEQYKFDEMIANAQQTGKIVIDKASGAWDFLKEQVGVLFSKISSINKQNADLITSENSSQYCIPDGKYNEFYKYLTFLLGSNVPLNGSNTRDCYLNTNCYYVLVNSSNNYTYLLHSYNMSEFNSMINSLSSGHIDIWDAVYFYFNNNNKANWSSAYGSAASKSTGIRLDSIVSYKILDNLSMQDAISLQNRGFTDSLANKPSYSSVYDPAPDHATDIITPGNTVIPNPDGSYAIGGNYVIDVTNPVTYPVDLTDGVTLDDSKTPITELAPAEDQPGEIEPDPEPEPEPELSFWERLFEWLKRIYDLLTQLPQILTDHGLTLGNIVTSLSSINLTVGAIQQIADSLLTAFNGLEIPDYSDLIQEVPSKIAEALEFPEINFPEIEIPDYTSIFEQMLEFLSYLPKLGNIESLLTSIFVVDFNAVNDALYKALDVWDFDFLKDLQNLIGLLKYADDYRYPKFKIKCPAILAPYYDDDEIVLCDFANYKVQLLWCRNAIRMMLWVYFLYCVFRHFKVRFTVS